MTVESLREHLEWIQQYAAGARALDPGLVHAERHARAAVADLESLSSVVDRQQEALERIDKACQGVIDRISEVGEPRIGLAGTQLDPVRLQSFVRGVGLSASVPKEKQT